MCNRAMEGYLGASFVSTDWRVRVFWSSVLVDRPSEYLCVRNIPLYGYVDRRSRTSPFLLRHDWTITEKPEGSCLP